MANNAHKQIKHGAIISYCALAINIVAALLYTPWMIREIGQANYGLYTLAISFISLFLVDFGVSAALTRFLSKYRAENNTFEAKRILGATYTVYLAIDLFILISLTVIYFNLEWIYGELKSDEMQTFKIIFLIVGTFNLISFPAITQNGILNSYEKFIELKICDLGRKFLAIIFVVLALWNKMGIIAVVCANVIAELIAILIKLYIINHSIRLKPSFRNLDKSIYKAIFSFSIWMTIISFAQKFVYNIAPTILGIVSGAIAISIYGPASSLGSYYYAVAVAVNGLFLPHVSRKIVQKKEEDIQRLMIQMGQFQMMLLGFVFATFVSIGKNFIILWLGEGFDLSYICTVLVFLPAMFEYSQQIGATMIVAKNLVKYQAIGFIIISVITLAVSFVLGKIGGAPGVCLSICIAGFANVALQNWIFSKKLNLNMSEFWRKAVLPAIPTILTTIIIGGIINNYLEKDWIMLCVSASFILVIYLICVIVFQREIFHNIMSYIKK